MPCPSGYAEPSVVSAAPSCTAHGHRGHSIINFLDLSFREFLTPILIELHYGLSAAVVRALGWIVALFLGFAAGPRVGLLILVLGPVVAMWMLSIIRIACEGLLAQVQTAQNTAN